MRASYRAESILHIAAVLLILLAIPVTAALGTETYALRVQQNDRVAASIHPVQATLNANAKPGVMVYGVMTVQAHWTFNGRVHTDDLIVDAKAKAGDHLSIWVNGNGEQTAKPPTHSQAMPDAIAMSVGVFGLFVGLILGLWHGIGWWLDRRRRADWSKEWAALEHVPKWHHP